MRPVMEKTFGKAARLAAIIPLIALGLVLTACGGGGGGASVNNSPGVVAQQPTSPPAGAEGDSVGQIIPNLDPVHSSVGYRVPNAGFEAATAELSGTTVLIRDSDGDLITTRSVNVIEMARATTLDYIRPGIWAEGNIGTTSTTGAFFLPENNTAIASVSGIAGGRLGRARSFRWDGTYEAYVNDVRDGVSGAKGVSRIQGDMSLELTRNVLGAGCDMHSIALTLSPPTRADSTFSSQFSSGNPSAAQIDQTVRLSTTISASGQSGTGAFELTPIVKVTQGARLRFGDDPLYPTTYLPSDTYVVGAFFGPAGGGSDYAREVGGVYRFDITHTDGLGTVRTVGAFGARR